MLMYDSKHTCSCEAPHQSMGQLARTYEAHTHSTSKCTNSLTGINQLYLNEC